MQHHPAAGRGRAHGWRGLACRDPALSRHQARIVSGRQPELVPGTRQVRLLGAAHTVTGPVACRGGLWGVGWGWGLFSCPRPPLRAAFSYVRGLKMALSKPSHTLQSERVTWLGSEPRPPLTTVFDCCAFKAESPGSSRPRCHGPHQGGSCRGAGCQGGKGRAGGLGGDLFGSVGTGKTRPGPQQRGGRMGGPTARLPIREGLAAQATG